MEAGTGLDQGFLVERFGPFDLRFQLNALPEGLAWSLESADGERYVFDIDVTFPVIGSLMHYRGWLLPQDDVSDRQPPRSA